MCLDHQQQQPKKMMCCVLSTMHNTIIYTFTYKTIN